MAASCVFCDILAGERPGHPVYETDRVVAFLDVNPLRPGHTLVVPADHYERVNDLPADLAADLFGAVHALLPAVEAAADAEATTIAFNNGRAAGQEVPHVHGHVVPREPGDGGGPIHAAFGPSPGADPGDLAAMADRIADRLGAGPD